MMATNIAVETATMAPLDICASSRTDAQMVVNMQVFLAPIYSPELQRDTAEHHEPEGHQPDHDEGDAEPAQGRRDVRGAHLLAQGRERDDRQRPADARAEPVDDRVGHGAVALD